MIPVLASSFKQLVAPLRRVCPRPTPLPAPLPAPAFPLAQLDRPLPLAIATDPLVQKYVRLLGDLPWATFPERTTDRPWPGPTPELRAPFVAAFVIKLHEHKTSMPALARFLDEHPALCHLLGWSVVPDRRQLSRVLRDLPNDACQFLLSATTHLLQQALPEDEQAFFGNTIAGDTKHILAWVAENNPKQFIKQGRLDKTRQPIGDGDCKLGVKKRHNSSPEQPPTTPATEAKPASSLHVGVDVLWGYASGVVASRTSLGEVVLAERTRPFNESDPSYFHPLMQQVEQRLGRRPQFGAWDTAFDAFYVYEYFYHAGGMAAVPFNSGKKGEGRVFAADGSPLCAAGLPMPRLFVYLDRSALVPHQREKCGCPLLHPHQTGQSCPIADEHFAKDGCTTTLAVSVGARIRHQLDRQGEDYKKLYAQRTVVERINSQAEALGIERPKLRNGRSISNQNTLMYVLINLRVLERSRS